MIVDDNNADCLECQPLIEDNEEFLYSSDLEELEAMLHPMNVQRTLP